MKPHYAIYENWEGKWLGVNGWLVERKHTNKQILHPQTYNSDVMEKTNVMIESAPHLYTPHIWLFDTIKDAETYIEGMDKGGYNHFYSVRKIWL